MGPFSKIDPLRAGGRTFCPIFTVSLGGGQPN